jgi:hydroxymethylbilane synthase
VTPRAPAAALAIGTRGSPLAREQTRIVADLLARAWPGLECRARILETRGDRTQGGGAPLPAIGGKGLFTAELESALRAGAIDLAVHSLKDLPTADTPGLTLAAVPIREDVRDCLVSADGATLAELPAGATVGTSSPRRAAQLRALRSDLRVEPVRGNVETRVRKVRERALDAVLVAAAGIRRLGLEQEVAEWLSVEVVLPAPGQGALAVQCRADDEAVLEVVRAIDDPVARRATSAERSFLAALATGCSAPVGAYAQPVAASEGGDAEVVELELDGLVASLDGQRLVRVRGRGRDPELLGARLAQEALAAGASEILAAIRG